MFPKFILQEISHAKAVNMTYSRLFTSFKNFKIQYYLNPSKPKVISQIKEEFLHSKLPYYPICNFAHTDRSKQRLKTNKTGIKDDHEFGDLHKMNDYLKNNKDRDDLRFKVYEIDAPQRPDNNNPEDLEGLSEEKLNTMNHLYPTPKVTLNNWQSMQDSKQFDVQYKNIEKLKIKLKKNSSNILSWGCVYKFHSPQPMVFEEQGMTKMIASDKAALKAISWLLRKNLMTKEGYPIYSAEKVDELKKDQNKPIQLSISEAYEKPIKDLIAKYDRDINPLLTKIKNNKISTQSSAIQIPVDLRPTAIEKEDLSDEELSDDEINQKSFISDKEFHDLIFGTPINEKDPDLMEARSFTLKKNLSKRNPETSLPITEYRENIVNVVKENRAVVIRGAPGCGKSTRVPSYILDAFSANGNGAECSILISQPRRVAALSLATTVAKERNEQLGDVCGHQVRLSTVLPKGPGGCLLYCTAGALLRRLASTPELPGCSHIILDEAHERSIDSDTVMALAKRAMQINPNLKVIVMSATIDTELFSKYFDNCPIIDIPGKTYPVTSHFLEDYANKVSMHRTLEYFQKEDYTDNRVFINHYELVKLIKWVDQMKPEGAILVFLPGWSEIKKVQEQLSMVLSKSNNHMVLPIHSRLSNMEQRKIFSFPPPGVRKIILATNIAETSITIGDVVYVIDCGVHKENTLLNDKGISSLDNTWISKANANQRKGRAGRVKAGECFHLYTREKFQEFNDNPIPEILRVPLEKTVLDCKTYSSNEKAFNFLSQFPQSPSRDAIQVAVQDLVELGALDKFENLTPLGQRIASFTTHPKLSKALVYSSILGVTDPIVDIVTMLSSNIDLFSYLHSAKQDIRNIKREYHPTSDHQSMYWIVKEFEDIIEEQGKFAADTHCRDKYMRREKLFSVIDLRRICMEHLRTSKMIAPNYHKDLNNMKYASVDELVKGILLSGLNTLVYTKNFVKTKGKLGKEKTIVTDRGQRAFISSESVNYGIEKKTQRAILLHCGAIHSEERRGILIRDTSVVSPLTVMLFSSEIHEGEEDEHVKAIKLANKKIIVHVPIEQANTLLKFREILWSVMNYYIENKGYEKDLLQEDDSEEGGNSEELQIDEFKEQMLKIIAKLLHENEVIVENK